jgi:hypothetical protein
MVPADGAVGEGVSGTGDGEVVEVKDGVNIACKVNAAAVCTSSGGRTCSKGVLQASTAASKTKVAILIFNLEFISEL